jgi:hypothetical protein
MKKYLMLLLLFIASVEYLYAQASDLSAEEKKRIKKLHKFCQYIKEKEYEQINQALLFRKYLAFGYIVKDTTQNYMSQRLFAKLLKELDQRLDTMDIRSFDAIPWYKYAYPENLPRMVWQAEPVIEIFGQAIEPSGKTKREEEVAIGRKRLENVLVCFKKDKPGVPLYYMNNQIKFNPGC